MTREEAEAIVEREIYSIVPMPLMPHISEVRPTPAGVVRVLVALGMLKLDEPKSANDRAIEVFNAAASDRFCGPTQLLIRLDAAGLKIVEK